MNFFVVLCAGDIYSPLTHPYLSRIDADAAATDALKNHVSFFDSAGKNFVATKAYVVQVMAEFETSVSIKERA